MELQDTADTADAAGRLVMQNEMFFFVNGLRWKLYGNLLEY